eukprot:1897303-Pyramimonas_sp.AAC.1
MNGCQDSGFTGEKRVGALILDTVGHCQSSLTRSSAHLGGVHGAPARRVLGHRGGARARAIVVDETAAEAHVACTDMAGRGRGNAHHHPRLPRLHLP